MPEEAMKSWVWERFKQKSKRKNFSLFGEKVHIMGSLIWLWVLFHVFPAILIKAPSPYVVVGIVGIFRWPLAANKVS